MPQVFNVLNCCGCGTFQVHQVVKAKKWACKMCGVKQSFVKVFSEGTGAECRQHVQKLNMMSAQKSSTDVAIAVWGQQEDAVDRHDEPDPGLVSPTTDKWSKYVDEGEQEARSGEDVEDDPLSTTDFRTFQKRKRTASSRGATGGSERKYGRNDWFGTVTKPRPTDSFSPLFQPKTVAQRSVITAEVNNRNDEVDGSDSTEMNDFEKFLLCADDFDEPFDIEESQTTTEISTVRNMSDNVQEKIASQSPHKKVQESTNAGSKWAKYVDEADESNRDSDEDSDSELSSSHFRTSQK